MSNAAYAAWCRESGLCVRCYLRVTGEHRADAYDGTEDDISEACGYRCSLDGATCPACLGSLQDSLLNSVPGLTEPHVKNVRHCGWYKVTVSLPASAALVRERAFFVVLRQAFPEIHRPLSLREVFKLALSGRLAKMGLTYRADAELFLDVSLSHPESEGECDFASRVSSESNGKKKRARFNRKETGTSTTVVTRVVGTMSDVDFCNAVGQAFLPPPKPSSSVSCTVAMSVASIFLAGEYNKFSRVISQTPWLVGMENDDDDALPQYALSVESVICAGLDKLFRPERVTFTAGGREDVDVRMLGGGRPFVVELANPGIVASRVTNGMLRETLDASEKMSMAVRANNLRVVPKDFCAEMRVYESEKRKSYRCVVWTDRAVPEAELKRILENQEGFLLKQKTPLRVLHRRNLAVRERMIYEAVVRRVITPHFFVLDLVSAAGTYIKEFVHGDNGRTLPNVGKLLQCKADILQLDVLGIKSLNTAS